MMPVKSLIPTLLLSVTLVACSSDDDAESSALEPDLSERARAVLAGFETQDSTALNDYVSELNYTQHNLSFPDGREAVAGAIDSGALGGTTVQTLRSFVDGDVVFLHSVYGGSWNGGVPQVALDVFRFEEGLIVEHWDNLAAVEDDGDGTSQTDGTLEADPLVDTEASRTLVADAMQALFIEGQWSTIADYFDEENYQQHSLGAGADFSGLAQIVAALPEGTPFYSSVEYLYAEHDFVLTMSEGFPNADSGLSDAYFDLFRVADGRIVEHWDIIQTIPAQSSWANENGKW